MFNNEINPKGFDLLGEQLAESGLEMNIIGAVIGAATSIFGASQQSSAADKANKRAKEQVEAQYEYDKERYSMSKDKLKADRNFAIEQIQTNIRNDERLADLKNQQSLDNFGFNLKIREQQMKNYTRQYDKSSTLYDQQLSYNDFAATNASNVEQLRMNDAMSQAAFQNEDLFVQGLQETGTMMARGQAGKSVRKGKQSLNAQLGRNQNIVMANLLSSRSTMRNALAQIATQRTGADIQAFANLMIPQDAPPEVLEPYAAILPEYTLPRELQDFDYGPEPSKGVAAQVSTSAPWLNALGSVSSNLVSAFSNNGPSNFGYSGGGGNMFSGSTGNFGSGIGTSLAGSGSSSGFGSSFFGL
tara:strand:+ start:2735 stop:3808 length:1074 start_codon:yes stop_codon:yes gene_type:complete